MNRGNSEDNWKHFNNNVAEQQSSLNDGQLACKVLDMYEMLDDRARRDLSEWEKRLLEIRVTT